MFYQLPLASASGKVEQLSALAKLLNLNNILIALAQIRLKPKGISIF